MRLSHTLTSLLLATAVAASASAHEYYVGGPVKKNDMEIAANYLIGVEMAPMPAGMDMDKNAIHLEADVHATADNAWGFPDGFWIPMLTINYTLEKEGTTWKKTGKLVAMQAKDGPHYANNVAMNGPGKYKVTYQFISPTESGYIRHTDKETGLPEWWKTFSETFEFQYPQK